MIPQVHRRTCMLIVLVGGFILLIALGIGQIVSSQPLTPLSQVLSLAARHQITRAEIDTSGIVHVRTIKGQVLMTHKEAGQVLTPLLMAGGAQVTINDDSGVNATSLFADGLLALLVGGILFFLYRQSASAGGRLRLGNTTTTAERAVPTGVTFGDVGGVDEAKNDLVELVEFLSAPERFTAIGARIPRGVLLSGPPGTGKTLMARAVAGEAKVPFFSISGSAFVEMYVGVGAARVRELFAKARKAAPAIVFIDELDAIGGKRSSGNRGGNDEREHTLNQLLVEMDGFATASGVIVLAATNRPDMLDSALLRPGRFDRRVTMTLPDRAGRKAVLALHSARVKLDASVDMDALAGQTSGMSPADLANMINEAALLAARDRLLEVSAEHLDMALLRVLAGPEMKSRVMPATLKRVIAYHEVGHAVVMKLLPHCDPVAKVQAIARGNALGITVSMPKEDQYLLTRSALRERMVGIMGGRAAESIFFGEVTTGAQQDIQQANAIARRMVAEFGMSPLGHVCIGDGDMLSPELAAQIDAATRVLVEEAYTHALTLIGEHREAIAAIADHLYEVETIDGADLDSWLARYPAQPASSSGDGIVEETHRTETAA